jgi:hypothetical protein
MRKSLTPNDETLNGLNNRQTATVILTLVINLLSRFPGSIKLHNRGSIYLIYISLPPKFRNFNDVPPYYIYNRREFTVKSCLRKLFGEKMKNGKDNENIVKMRRKKKDSANRPPGLVFLRTAKKTDY